MDARCRGAPAVSANAFLISDVAGTHCAAATYDGDAGAVQWTQCAPNDPAQQWTLQSVVGGVGLLNGVSNNAFSLWLGAPAGAVDPSAASSAVSTAPHTLVVTAGSVDGFTVAAGSGVHLSVAGQALEWSSASPTVFYAEFLEVPTCAP